MNAQIDLAIQALEQAKSSRDPLGALATAQRHIREAMKQNPADGPRRGPGPSPFGAPVDL